MAKNWYIITYDIREPKRLRKVAKHLEGYGTRMQYSVFRCRLHKRELKRLQWELKKIVEDEDDVMFIGLCANCADAVEGQGKLDDWSSKNSSFEII